MCACVCAWSVGDDAGQVRASTSDTVWLIGLVPSGNTDLWVQVVSSGLVHEHLGLFVLPVQIEERS